MEKGPTQPTESRGADVEKYIPNTPDEIRARISEIDREIVSATTTGSLSNIPKKNDLGTEMEDDALEEAANFQDFSAREESVDHLRKEKQELESRLHELLKSA